MCHQIIRQTMEFRPQFSQYSNKCLLLTNNDSATNLKKPFSILVKSYCQGKNMVSFFFFGVVQNKLGLSSALQRQKKDLSENEKKKKKDIYGNVHYLSGKGEQTVLDQLFGCSKIRLDTVAFIKKIYIYIEESCKHWSVFRGIQKLHAVQNTSQCSGKLTFILHTYNINCFIHNVQSAVHLKYGTLDITQEMLFNVSLEYIQNVQQHRLVYYGLQS